MDPRAARWTKGHIGRLGVAVAAAAATAGAGCSFGFDDETTVKDLRVLSIAADPPELLIDPMMLVDPGPSTLRPLVVDPLGGNARPVAFRAIACPNAVDESTPGGPGGPRGTVGTSRCAPGASELVGEGEALPGAIEVGFAPTADLAMRALAADPLGVLFGLPITLEFSFGAGGEEVVATKRVLYTPRLREGHEPNRNPTIAAVRTFRRRGEPKEPWDADGRSEVPIGSEMFVEPEIGEREAYPTRIFNRLTMMVEVKEVPHETLRYAFYASAGTFTPRQTDTEPSPLFEKTDEIHLETTYRAPAAMPTDPTVTVWIVVRDERGGSSHVVRTLNLVRQ